MLAPGAIGVNGTAKVVADSIDRKMGAAPRVALLEFPIRAPPGQRGQDEPCLAFAPPLTIPGQTEVHMIWDETPFAKRHRRVGMKLGVPEG